MLQPWRSLSGNVSCSKPWPCRTPSTQLTPSSWTPSKPSSACLAMDCCRRQHLKVSKSTQAVQQAMLMMDLRAPPTSRPEYAQVAIAIQPLPRSPRRQVSTNALDSQMSSAIGCLVKQIQDILHDGSCRNCTASLAAHLAIFF